MVLVRQFYFWTTFGSVIQIMTIASPFLEVSLDIDAEVWSQYLEKWMDSLTTGWFAPKNSKCFGKLKVDAFRDLNDQR